MNWLRKFILRLLHCFCVKFSLLILLFVSMGICISYLNDKPQYLFPLLAFILSSIGFIVTRPRLKIGATNKPSGKGISYKLKIQNKSFFPAKNCKLKISFNVNKNTIKTSDDAIIKGASEYPDGGIIDDPILWDEYINKDEDRSTIYHLGAFDSVTSELFSWESGQNVIKIASEINKPRIVLEGKFDLEIKIRLTGDNSFPLVKKCKITNNNGTNPEMSFL